MCAYAGMMDALEDVDAAFPGWHAWRGVNRLFYAQRRGSPPETIRTARLGTLIIRVAVRDAQIRAQLGQPARLTASGPAEAIDAPGGA